MNHALPSSWQGFRQKGALEKYFLAGTEKASIAHTNNISLKVKPVNIQPYISRVAIAKKKKDLYGKDNSQKSHETTREL